MQPIKQIDSKPIQWIKAGDKTARVKYEDGTFETINLDDYAKQVILEGGVNLMRING